MPFFICSPTLFRDNVNTVDNGGGKSELCTHLVHPHTTF
jgi:hypothetical protein